MSQKTAMQTLWEWIDANCHEDGFNINDGRDMSLKLEKEQIEEAIDKVLMSYGIIKLKSNGTRYF
jgi:uncharacterized protein YbcC (UPF0753/DUF2309 family)